MTSSPLLACVDVQLDLGGRAVLTGLNFEVESGAVGVVRGPSGSGKTSLFNLAMGLIHPDSGKIFVAGRDLADLDKRELARMRNREVGTIFQAYNLVVDSTAEENVMLPSLIGGWPEDPSLARQCLERVGMLDHCDDRAGALSGGERQRLAVARSLYTKPLLLLADEPTGNLDNAAARRVIDALRELHTDGTTVLVASHDRLVAETLPVLLELGGKHCGEPVDV